MPWTPLAERIRRHATDVGAEGGQLAHVVLIAAVDVLEVMHTRLAVGHDAREHPMRMSTAANMKRFSKTFSVMTDTSSARAASSMN